MLRYISTETERDQEMSSAVPVAPSERENYTNRPGDRGVCFYIFTCSTVFFKFFLFCSFAYFFLSLSVFFFFFFCDECVNIAIRGHFQSCRHPMGFYVYVLRMVNV